MRRRSSFGRFASLNTCVNSGLDELPSNYTNLSPEQIQNRINTAKNDRNRAAGAAGGGGGGGAASDQPDWVQDLVGRFQRVERENAEVKQLLAQIEQANQNTQFGQQALRDDASLLQSLTSPRDTFATQFLGGLSGQATLNPQLASVLRGASPNAGALPRFLGTDPVSIAAATAPILRNLTPASYGALGPQSQGHLGALVGLAGLSAPDVFNSIQTARPRQSFLYAGQSALR